MNTVNNPKAKFKFSFKWIVFILVLIALLAYGVKSLFFPDQNKDLKPKQGPQTIVSTKVIKKDFPVIIETSGNIVAANIVDVRPQVTNVISKIHFKDGQNVKAGDLLFSLDNRADLANYEKAKALADDAQRQYQRSLELLKQNFISQATVDTTLANANSAVATANAAAVTLSYDSIRSPISGRAGVINVFLGQLVQPGNVISTQTTSASTSSLGSMVTITQLNPIHVQFMIPEAHMASLLQLQKSSGALQVKIDIGNGQSKQGKVFVIDNQIDPSIGSVKVKASLDNSDDSLAPGGFVNVTLQTNILKDNLVVPSQSIISNTNGDQIYVIENGDTVALKKIKILAQNNGFAAVSGVNENDRIVVEGKQNLRPGSKVVEASAGKEENKKPPKVEDAAKSQ